MSKFRNERPKSLALKNQDIAYSVSDHAKHTWSYEEKIAFSMHVNQCLADDEILKDRLPLDVNSMDLFDQSKDGLLFCRLINLASPDAIDERALNTKKNLNVYQKTENINLAINASKAIGCKVVNIGSHDIAEGSPTLVLGLVWQIIKIQLLSQITLQNFPELVCLLEEGEDLATFIKCSPETILLRWVNYHLKEAGSTRRITNFGSDVSDSEVYSIVMNKIKPQECPRIPASETDPIKRAKKAIENAQKYGAETFILPTDIVAGNKKLNMTFVAQLFNTDHGLNPPSEELLADLDLDDAGDSREERVLRMWINSLNMEGVYVNYLFADVDDGTLILKLIDNTKPGCIEWKRVNKDPTTKFKKVENCNMAVTKCSQELGLSMVNVGGLDIMNVNKKMILAIIVQLFRKYTLSVLATLASTSSNGDITDADIVNWANSKVEAAALEGRMKNFKDKTLATGKFFIQLIAALKPQAIDWSKVTEGETLEDKAANARYCLSSAMKIGAAVFLTPEDIMEVNSKMLVNFVASVWISQI